MVKTPMASDRECLAYWATIENYRWWLAHDHVYLSLIKDRGQFSNDIVRTVAKAYGVNRGIPASDDKKADHMALGIASALNDFDAKSFQAQPMKEKIARFQSLVEKMPMNQDVKQGDNPIFVSGASKLLWFVAPRGWTMFDKLAADGMGIKKSLPSMERAKDYYTALAGRKFDDTTSKIRKILDQSDFSSLYAERLIDKFLWLAGCQSETWENSRLSLRYYMQGLFPVVRDKLEALAKQIEAAVRADLNALVKSNGNS